MSLSKYEPAIVSLIKAIEPLDDLLRSINVPYKVWHNDVDEKQSDAAQVFGGFLRWIVETVELGNGNVTLEAFLSTGSDIDIAVEPHPGCSHKLAEYFKRIIKNGGSVEYAGVKYGESDLMDVTFHLDDYFSDRDNNIYGEQLTPGNYMVYAMLGGRHIKIDVIVDGKEKTDFTVNALRYPDVSGQRRNSGQDSLTPSTTLSIAGSFELPQM